MEQEEDFEPTNELPRRPPTFTEKLSQLLLMGSFHTFVPPPPIPGKKTLILDLDETLVHTEAFKPHPSVNYILFPDSNDYVFLRPGVEEVLKYGVEMFDVLIFTAATQPYADFVIDSLCPSIPPDRRFYRDSCFSENGRAIKYLNMFKRRPQDLILVDDNKKIYKANPENTLNIEPWKGFPEDIVLFYWLIPTLMKCAKASDVRPVIKEAMCQKQSI